MYNIAPTNGALTGKRTFIDFANPQKTDFYYRDERYTNDAWGNRITENQYTNPGTYSVPSSGIIETTTYQYDAVYHTYLLTQTNALGQSVGFTYTYTLGLPDSMTGLNGPATTIRVVYDGLGRPVKVVRPGDSIDAPTLQVTYSDSLAPFPLELRQRIEGSG